MEAQQALIDILQFEQLFVKLTNSSWQQNDSNFDGQTDAPSAKFHRNKARHEAIKLAQLIGHVTNRTWQAICIQCMGNRQHKVRPHGAPVPAWVHNNSTSCFLIAAAHDE
eukprot:6408382-Amphidinium_carterae.2